MSFDFKRSKPLLLNFCLHLFKAVVTAIAVATADDFAFRHVTLAVITAISELIVSQRINLTHKHDMYDSKTITLCRLIAKYRNV